MPSSSSSCEQAGPSTAEDGGSSGRSQGVQSEGKQVLCQQGKQKKKSQTLAELTVALTRERQEAIIDFANKRLEASGIEGVLAVHPTVVEILKKCEAESSPVQLVNEGFAIKDPWWCDPAVDVKTREDVQEDGTRGVKYFYNDKELHQKDRRGANRSARREKKNSPYICIFCAERYADATDLTRHTRTHTRVHPYRCDICKKGFKQNVSLESHLKKEHGAEKPARDYKQIKHYICELTGEMFIDVDKFIQHQCEKGHLNMANRAKDRRIMKRPSLGSPPKKPPLK